MDSDMKRIIERLEELVPEVVRVNETAMDDALNVVLADARRNVRVGKGTLRDSIRKRRRRRGSSVMGTVGSSEESALFNEFGVEHMPSQPFLYPALKANRARIREIFARKQREGLRKG